jgi:hypothetical protein
MPKSDLDSIVYVSSAVRLFSLDETEYLVKRARERNKEYGITGVKLQIDGNFIEYLEGPKENLDIIYKIIREDEQHTGLILIAREAIESRLFGDWPLAYFAQDGGDYVGSPGERQLFETILELPDDNPSTAQIVLNSFWYRSGSQ